jgi:hypothetical protein
MIPESQKSIIINEFTSSLKEALKNNPDFSQIREIRAVKDFYDKAKDRQIEPSMVLSIINESLLNNLSDGFLKEFSSSLQKNLDGLTLSFDKTGLGFNYSLPEISTTLDFDLVVNETNTTIATITIGASLETDFTVEGIHKSDVSINIDKIEFNVSLFLFTEMILGRKKKQIASRKFNIENIKI